MCFPGLDCDQLAAVQALQLAMVGSFQQRYCEGNEAAEDQDGGLVHASGLPTSV